MMNSRRRFLQGLGASVGAVAAGVAAPQSVERKIVKDVVEYRAVYSDVLITHGDGNHDDDTAMMKIDGDYRSVVRLNGKWRLMFPK